MNKPINGDIDGIRNSHIKKLQQLYELNTDKTAFVSPEVIELLREVTLQTNREISVYLDRKGKVEDVSVGSNATVTLGDVEGKRKKTGLSGFRCVHTHPDGSAQLSDVDLSALEALELDAMAALSVKEGIPSKISVALLNPDYIPNKSETFIFYGPCLAEAVNDLDIIKNISLIDAKFKNRAPEMEQFGLEKAILIALCPKGSNLDLVQDSLDELSRLADTAGVEVLTRVVQQKDRRDAATYIGRGKADELRLDAQVLGANVLIFDDELSPAQQRNLESITNIKIIDRTALILDIFAQRARTTEGKLQVELAQLTYMLPRLMGKGTMLSRLGGGIGTRGPGETKLEVDRRRIRKRISDLNDQLELVRKNRSMYRENRKSAELPIVALCGYTNAGKSTLLNRLTHSDVFAEDKLFATLDPTTRKLELPDHRTILASDTVGFINKIPHDLVASFRATLEEVLDADLLLHVVDTSHAGMEQQMDAVTTILAELGAADKPTITVFNKTDQSASTHVDALLNRTADSVAVSALTGQGIDELLNSIVKILPDRRFTAVLELPYSKGEIESFLHKNGKVLSINYEPEYIAITVEIDKKFYTKLEPFIAKENT